MRPLHVGVRDLGLGDQARLFQGARAIQGKTFGLIASMVAFHKGI